MEVQEKKPTKREKGTKWLDTMKTRMPEAQKLIYLLALADQFYNNSLCQGYQRSGAVKNPKESRFFCSLRWSAEEQSPIAVLQKLQA